MTGLDGADEEPLNGDDGCQRQCGADVEGLARVSHACGETYERNVHDCRHQRDPLRLHLRRKRQCGDDEIHRRALGGGTWAVKRSRRELAVIEPGRLVQHSERRRQID